MSHHSSLLSPSTFLLHRSTTQSHFLIITPQTHFPLLHPYLSQVEQPLGLHSYQLSSLLHFHLPLLSPPLLPLFAEQTSGFLPYSQALGARHQATQVAPNPLQCSFLPSFSRVHLHPLHPLRVSWNDAFSGTYHLPRVPGDG